MSMNIELDDTLGEADALLTALFLAAGSLGDRKDAAALQFVAVAAQDSIRHARSLISENGDTEAVNSERELLSLGDDLAALMDRFDRLKAIAGGQGE